MAQSVRQPEKSLDKTHQTRTLIANKCRIYFILSFYEYLTLSVFNV